MDNIRHIIFDFGGVIYKINPNLTFELFCQKSKTYRKNLGSDYQKFFRHNILNDFETGILPPDSFRNLLKQEMALVLTDEEFDIIWNATLIELNTETVFLLKKLSNKYRMTLLSNTNVIHYDHFYPQCKDIFTIFDHTFFSFKLGMRKPEKEIFELAINKTGLKQNQILFIDDSDINIKGAMNAGLNTFLYEEETGNKKLTEILLSD